MWGSEFYVVMKKGKKKLTITLRGENSKGGTLTEIATAAIKHTHDVRRVRCRGSNWRSLETGAAFALLLPSLLRLCSVLWVSAAGKGKEGPTLSATPGSSSILSVTHSLNVQHA